MPLVEPKPDSLNRIRFPAGLRLLRRFDFPHKLGVLDRLFGASLHGQSTGWADIHPGWLWKLDPRNPTHRWMVYGDYQGPAFWNWLRTNHAQVHHVVDSGANIGQTIAYFCRICPGVRVEAFEPGEQARAWLEECLTQNGLDRVLVHPRGLSNRSTTARLEASGPLESHGSWNSLVPDESGSLQLSTLDAEALDGKWNAVDLWKIDVEGHECEVIAGAEALLSAGRIRSIYLEAGERSLPQLRACLEKHGFSGWQEDGPSFRPLESGWNKDGNYLFIGNHSGFIHP